MFKLTGALLIAMFGTAAAAHAATEWRLPPTPQVVTQQAADAQQNICRHHAICVNAAVPAPLCLPLGLPIWICWGGIRRSDQACAITTWVSGPSAPGEPARVPAFGRTPVTHQTCWGMPLLRHKGQPHRGRAWHIWRRAWSATTF